MFRKIFSYVSLLLLLFLSNNSGNPAPGVAQNAPDGFNPGPDIITGNIGELGDLEQFGSDGTQVGLGVSTTACNAGNVPVNFAAMPSTNHPVIPHNLYRMSGGSGNNERFEQIGQSWVKHAYGSKQASTCFSCQPGGDFSHLGVGCSDSYANYQNATQSDLGSRALINPFTGVFQPTAREHTGHAHTGTSHRILVEGSDLNTTLNPGATYYVEVQYISSDEYAWCQAHPGECNMYNNSSYRRYNVSGATNFTFTEVGPTVRMAPAVNAWTGATIALIEPEPGVDGRAFLAYKVTGPVGGLYHYEYALYNENLDRAIQSFSLPLGCGITLSNLGFHAPLNHPGFPNDGTLGDAGFSNAPWSSNQTTDAVSWSSETFAQNQNANAIRWGTLYNFRFDSDRAPLFTAATIGFFKTGTPVTVGILAPNACNVTPSPFPTATPIPSATPVVVPTPTPSASPTPVPTPILPPAGNGKVVFRRNGQIYVMDADGANPTNITNSPSTFSKDPAWSPDGTKIAFARVQDPQFGSPDIYVMNANGSNLIRLTTNPRTDDEPAWSPDGTKIAFHSDQNNNTDIYVMNANGSNPTRLTTDPEHDSQPAWSPDGGKIAFSRYQNGLRQVFVMDANGSNQTPLTTVLAEQFDPAWSPDGTKIAFTRSYRIWVMSAYGGNPTQLTTSSRDGSPVWSPDGTKIAFYRSDPPTIELTEDDIFVMNADGSNPINFTNSSAYDDGPDWQRIAVAPSPTPPAGQALNLSTRMRVQTGDNVGIGGFIITGSTPRHVLLRAIGPSLTPFGIPDALADPALELNGPGGFVTITNNNWRENPAQEAAILAAGIPPANDLESAIDAMLAPGAYTAIVRGTGNTSGVALVEAYDLSQAAPGKLGNISTRAFVGTGPEVVIAGFILGGNSGNTRIVARGIGPSLTATGVPDALANPALELRDNNGALLAFNFDWQDNLAQATELSVAGLAPTNALEAAIVATLPPGLYTAVLTGMNNGIGVGLVEVYDLGAP